MACVDPDETAVSSRYTLFAIQFRFLTETPIRNNSSDQLQRRKSLLQKLRDDRVNAVRIHRFLKDMVHFTFCNY